MRITYRVSGATGVFDVPSSLALHVMYERIRAFLVSTHPQLARWPRLPILVADRLLNALADNRDGVQLGELLHCGEQI